MQGIEVQVYRYEDDGTGYSQWNQISGAQTDETGAYDIGGLQAGTYHVGFYDNNWPSQYISEYYDDQPDVESAQDIELIAGQTRSDINAQLATTGHITGIVTDAAGPLQGIEVQVDRYHEDIEMGGGWWDYEAA